MGKVGEGWEMENQAGEIGGTDTQAKEHTHVPPSSPLAR